VTPAEKIVEYARAMSRRARHPGSDGWAYGSIHDVVLDQGRVFDPAPLPDNVYPALPGHSSKAAAILADRLAAVYVEGLALLPDARTVIEHAWCTTFTGDVIDPNLAGDSAAAYLGVAFTMRFRRDTLARAAGTRPILLSGQDGRPHNLDLLEHGLPTEAVLKIGKPLPGREAPGMHTPRDPFSPATVHARRNDRLAPAA